MIFYSFPCPACFLPTSARQSGYLQELPYSLCTTVTFFLYIEQIELVPQKHSKHQEILLLEDNTQCSNRRSELGVIEAVKEITVGIHHVSDRGLIETIIQKPTNSANVNFALDLIDKHRVNLSEQVVIAASSKYGCSINFLQNLQRRKLSFCVKIRPSTKLICSENKELIFSDLVDEMEDWNIINFINPITGKNVEYSVHDLGFIVKPIKSRAFIAQHKGVSGVNAGTIIGLSSLFDADITELVKIIGWTNWIRPILRNKRAERQNLTGLKSNINTHIEFELNLHSNITNGCQEEKELSKKELSPPNFRGVLQSTYSDLNIVELFAGAGGMGLGFLMANNYKNVYRVIFSGEVHPIYAQTLRQNHEAISRIYHSKHSGFVPDGVEPLDLRNNLAYESIEKCANKKGGVQIIIGGPPCQGFSSSNRNSGDESNPHNRLVEVFMDYVERIRPPVALMENVQGIVWAKNYDSTHESLLDYFTYRMKKAGYLVFKRLLDAAWYGVPQFRYRFFAVLIHQDLGYREEDFDPEWGAFPFPTHGGQGEKYVTVEQAISDLPPIGNGWNQHSMSYGKSEFVGVASARRENRENIRDNRFLQLMRQSADPRIITDHITSRHADYVIERYREIPPGGNWQSIKDKMTNYANLDRTHSNIYRRLTWSDPSVTIGHYRKSMLVHPEQHRGLSFREAARLQSFPDWFLFAGTSDGRKGGLMHKQQQVANAVCPLLTKAIAEFILKL